MPAQATSRPTQRGRAGGAAGAGGVFAGGRLLRRHGQRRVELPHRRGDDRGHQQREAGLGGDFRGEAGAHGGVDLRHHAAERRDDRDPPGVGAQPPGKVVGQRGQAPGAALAREQGVPQADHEGREDREAHGGVPEPVEPLAEVVARVEPAQQPLRGGAGEDHVRQHGGRGQQGAPQPARGQFGRRDAHEQALAGPVADHQEQQCAQQADEEGPAPFGFEGALRGLPGLDGQDGQALGVRGPCGAQVAPEGGAQGRIGACGEFGLELLAPLAQQVGAELFRIDGDQARELEVRIDGGALLGEGAALLDDVGRVGGRAFFGGGAESGEAAVQVRQVGRAAGHHLLGRGADGVGLVHELAAVVLVSELAGDGLEALAQLVHGGQRRVGIDDVPGGRRRSGRDAAALLAEAGAEAGTCGAACTMPGGHASRQAARRIIASAVRGRRRRKRSRERGVNGRVHGWTREGITAPD